MSTPVNPIKVLADFITAAPGSAAFDMWGDSEHGALLAIDLGIDDKSPYDEIEMALYAMFKDYILSRERELDRLFAKDRPVNP